MSYSDEQTFNLKDCGAEDLWIRYTSPGLLPLEKGEEFMRTHKLWNTKRMDKNGTTTMEEFLNDANAEFEWIMSLIVGWNLTYHGTEDIMPTPNEKPEIYKEVAGMYVAYIISIIKNDPTGADFLAKGLTASTNTLQQ